MCRSILYLYTKFLLFVDEEAMKMAGIEDQCFDCPACPAPTAEGDKLITMDGNFSQQCRNKPTTFDKSNGASSVDRLWVLARDSGPIRRRGSFSGGEWFVLTENIL
ncbi:unnamed protein product [Mucor hiemalis]